MDEKLFIVILKIMMMVFGSVLIGIAFNMILGFGIFMCLFSLQD